MKETKVYVDRDLLSSFYTRSGTDLGKRKWVQAEIVFYNVNNIYLYDIKTHDREKDKRIKELEQKVQELQEIDNKRAFRLYCMLYDMLEEKDPENVASRIDFMTSENYADICELYKAAKNLKQHDRELVKEVCEKIRERLSEQKKSLKDTFSPGKAFIISAVEDNLNKIEKEFEDGE